MKINILSDLLIKHVGTFHPVVPFNAQCDKLLPFDFTSANKDLTPDLISNTDQFTHYINDQLSTAGAKYGVGGYNELRDIYSRSVVFGADNAIDEPRRLHLGLDIWGLPNTPVIAPLDGLVHSFGYNDQFGDYGGTIILTHLLENFTFYTLYGHLSHSSIRNLSEGIKIYRGDIIGDFGLPLENGSWPPHLHFQIISSIGGYKGDFPGVCKFSEREQWLLNCPNPALMVSFLPSEQN